MDVKNIDVRFTLGGDCELILTLPKEERSTVNSLLEEYKDKAGKEWDAAIGVKKKKRSLDANAYLWVLCEKIAMKIQATKEEVYRKAVRDVGEFEDAPIRDDAVAFAVNQWTKMGIGFFCEALRKSNHTGYTVVRRYFGSHIYDTTSMSRLIDYIVQEAKELGIETMPHDEIERIKHLWQ